MTAPLGPAVWGVFILSRNENGTSSTGGIPG